MSVFNGQKTAVALGTFDGLHRGHIAVIASALAYKEQGLLPVVALFDVHPLSVISGKAPTALLQENLREEIISEMGAESAVIEFKKIQKFSCEQFVQEILVGRLNAAAVCCGEDYTFGAGATGTSQTLKDLCKRAGIECTVCKSVEYSGADISSTRIRESVMNGDFETANEMLGRPFMYKLTVVSGDRIGRLIGAPTINQYFPENFTVPKVGVYASAAKVDGREYPSVTNIGVRPSVNGKELRSETCILDFSADLYGKDIEVKLLKYLRGEQKFANLDVLSAQIYIDAEKSREVYSKWGESDV